MSAPNDSDSSQTDTDARLKELRTRVSRVKKAQLLKDIEQLDLSSRDDATGGVSLSPEDLTVMRLESVRRRPNHIVVTDRGADRDQIFISDFDDADNNILHFDRDGTDAIVESPKYP